MPSGWWKTCYSLWRLHIVRTIYVLFPLGRRPLVNEDNIMKFERDPDHPPTLTPEQRGRLEAMTDADVEAAALADPDAQPLTEEQLAQFERVPNIKAIREKLHLSQKQFAETFGLSLSVVRDWEQGRFFPDRAARTLLKVIAHNPQAVQEALAHRE
jgi:putative transcriptional regulator